jgi:hypothetical protein
MLLMLIMELNLVMNQNAMNALLSMVVEQLLSRVVLMSPEVETSDSASTRYLYSLSLLLFYLHYISRHNVMTMMMMSNHTMSL